VTSTAFPGAGRGIHPHLRETLPGRLHGRFARALIQFFLSALGDLAPLDFGGRGPCDRDFDGLARAPRPDCLGPQRQCTVGIQQGIAICCANRRPVGGIIGNPHGDVHVAVDGGRIEEIGQGAPGKQTPLGVVVAPAIVGVGLRLHTRRRGIERHLPAGGQDDLATRIPPGKARGHASDATASVGEDVVPAGDHQQILDDALDRCVGGVERLLAVAIVV
jgi:hypothetical protein